jgi:SAM-dependent methyltransferase
VTVDSGRSGVWHGIWDERDAERADWNGMEACWSSLEEYEAFMHRVFEVVRDGLGLTPDDRVLDLGCGTGRVAYEVAGIVDSVVGLDYSRTALEVARARRARPNLSYRWCDLNQLDVSGFGATKAFAMGAFLYLDSPEVVYRLLSDLQENGVAVAALDLPDADVADIRERHYDRSVYSHLQLRADDLLARFPTGRVARGDFPGYVNGASRFNFFLPARNGARRTT